MIAVAGIAACGGGLAPGFGWLRDRAPRGWDTVTIPTGARLIYPPSWRLAHGDRGTATAVLRAPSGQLLGYLNLTPREDGEQLATWPAFRLHHNREEGDREITRLAGASGLRFQTGTGSCVADLYTTRTGNRFREIACLVAGPRTSSVIVGASPPSAWGRIAATLERAIANVRD